MKIAVCVKQVPDTWADKHLMPDDNTVDRDSVDGVMNELDEYAVEEALRLKEAHGGDVTVLTMGPAKAVETLRKALSMGADEAVHICDPALRGTDALGTSLVLAKALHAEQYELVIFGTESTDARMAVIPAMVAERLGAAQLTYARAVEVTGSTIRIERAADDGCDRLEASTPAVVGVVEKINKPRYPSIKGIMAAKKKPLKTVTLADIGIDADDVGLAGACTVVAAAEPAPPRAKGQIIADEGDGGIQLAAFLASRKFI